MQNNGVIDWFRDEVGFLSNFYRYTLVYKGIAYPTSEHAYQAQKTNDFDTKLKIAALTSPQAAKAFANDPANITLRSDWETIKVPVMYAILRVKFNKDPMCALLLSTGDKLLIEGNRWHDNTWGQCICKDCSGRIGHNLLGKLLMLVREELKLQEDLQNVRQRESNGS